MKLYNRNFGVGERIEYMGWVNEAVNNSNQPWQSYRPRFLALKGPDLLLFETPPVCINLHIFYFGLIKKIISLYYNNNFNGIHNCSIEKRCNNLNKMSQKSKI